MNQNRTIGQKFALTSAALIALAIALAGVSLYNLNAASDAVRTFADDALPGLSSAGDIDRILHDLNGHFFQHIAASDAARIQKLNQEIADLKGEAEKAFAEYEGAITQADDRARFARVRPLFQKYFSAWEQVRPVSEANRNQEAEELFNRVVDPVFRETRALIAEINDWNKQYGDRTAKVERARAATLRTITWTLAIGAVLFGALVAWRVTAGINRALHKSMDELSTAADSVATAASQIASTSQALAQGSSEQAASLEETSASSEQVHATTKRNADNAREAAQLVTETQHNFEQANTALEAMVGAIGAINDSSDKISKIIRVIDEIAFQTNILALNAAVEAARAGEAGMGFAVVADEVRSLAHRCADAARETTGLIEDTRTKSADGKGKVADLASSIELITGQSARIQLLVQQVSTGSEEQVRGIQQISGAMVQMEQVTQRNAASAEESAAAGEELTGQSGALRSVVEHLSSLVGGPSKAR